MDRGLRRPNPDAAICAAHGKQRLRQDLIPSREHPGRLRCKPGHECRPDNRRRVGFNNGNMGRNLRRENARGGRDFNMNNNRGMRRRQMNNNGLPRKEFVPCSLHGRRRDPDHMVQVRAGVWECRPPFLCRDGPGKTPMQRRRRQRDGQGGGAAPFGARARGQQRGPGSAYLRFQPSDFRGGGGQDGAGGMMMPEGYGGAQYEQRRRRAQPQQVWCARHGKQLPWADAQPLEDCCYVCREGNSACLSAGLDAPSVLVSANCLEVLCCKHGTLRSPAFMEPNAAGTGYQCQARHPCRNRTVQQLPLDTSDQKQQQQPQPAEQQPQPQAPGQGYSYEEYYRAQFEGQAGAQQGAWGGAYGAADGMGGYDPYGSYGAADGDAASFFA